MTADHTPARDAVFALPLRVTVIEFDHAVVSPPNDNPLWYADIRGENAEVIARQIANAPTPDAARVIEVMRAALERAHERFNAIINAAEDGGTVTSLITWCQSSMAEIDAALTAAPEGQGTETEATDAMLAAGASQITMWSRQKAEPAVIARRVWNAMRAVLLQPPRGKGTDGACPECGEPSGEQHGDFCSHGAPR